MPALVEGDQQIRKRKRTQPDQDGDEGSALEILKMTPNGNVATRKTVNAEVNLLETQIKESQRHYNSIQALLTIAKKEARHAYQNAPATVALCRVFCRLMAEGRMSKSSVASPNELKIVDWLKQRYGDYQHILLHALENPRGSSMVHAQRIALHSGMQLVREEVMNAGVSADSIWRTAFFAKLFVALLRSATADEICDEFVEKYVNLFDDVRHYTFILISHTLADPPENNITELKDNSLSILSQIEPYDSTALTFDNLFAPCPAAKGVQGLSIAAHRKSAQKAWLAVLSSGLQKDQRKDVLQNLTHNVVPWFQNVELLMDFLTDSYNIGGATSLLSLSGLFYLIQEKNLDYPDFFRKLYSLLDSDLLYSKHRSRFFRLLNTFMASTHLPAALVASFIKRLSRLSLDAPPAAAVTIVPWVYNLLKAHPTCTFMIHRLSCKTENLQEVEERSMEDPFDMQETDPMETGAIDSCLWELVTLQSHYHPNVASLAKIISDQFTKTSYNLEDFLDYSYKNLITTELDKDLKKTPVVEYEIPKRIFVFPNGDNSLELLMNKILDAK